MPSITDSIGRVLGGRYRLVTPLGTGASAHVYLADDVSLHRRVAIKVLHPALAGDSAFLKRFRAEAQSVAALNHPNILQVYDWGEENDEPFLVLEYLAGGSLRQVYDTGALLTPEQAVQVGIEAAAGLDYAHRRGLIHRDIKPANLLFDADGRLRIADFGLARALAEAAWTEPDGAILGTARYAAPEQVEGWVLDGKADVYALALVLYEGVTGEAAVHRGHHGGHADGPGGLAPARARRTGPPQRGAGVGGRPGPRRAARRVRARPPAPARWPSTCPSRPPCPSSTPCRWASSRTSTR